MAKTASLIRALRPFLLLFLLALLTRQPSSPGSSFGPCSSAMALPTSMLNWNSLANFYPLSRLFRSSSSASDDDGSPSIALVVVKGPSDGHKASAIVQVQSTMMGMGSRQEEKPREMDSSDSSSSSAQRSTTATKQQRKFGTLKLCPPGGRSFFEAFELACPMKKRKKRHVMFGLGTRIHAESSPRMRKFHREEAEREEEEEKRRSETTGSRSNESYRPANISEIMRICCVSGCEFADFFPHCGPFSMW